MPNQYLEKIAGGLSTGVKNMVTGMDNTSNIILNRAIKNWKFKHKRQLLRNIKQDVEKGIPNPFSEVLFWQI